MGARSKGCFLALKKESVTCVTIKPDLIFGLQSPGVSRKNLLSHSSFATPAAAPGLGCPSAATTDIGISSLRGRVDPGRQCTDSDSEIDAVCCESR